MPSTSDVSLFNQYEGRGSILWAPICHFWAFPFLGVLGLFLYGIIGVTIAFFVSILAAMITLFAVNMLGGASGRLFTGRRPIWKLQEQYAGLLDQARHHKTQKRFDKALQIINGLLEEHPDFPDALYLKAQILWEGFGNSSASKGCLRKIMALVPDKDDTIYRWAIGLYKELAEVKAQPILTKKMNIKCFK